MTLFPRKWLTLILDRRWTAPNWMVSLGSLAIAFALWEVAVWLTNIPAYLIPAPSMILKRLIADWAIILPHTWVTSGEVLIGFGAAIVISIPTAAILSQFRILERAAYPLLVATQTIPKVAIAPLLVIWFGFGVLPKVIITFLICFFPILIDSLAGFSSLSKEVSWLGRSMGASQLQMFFKIKLPGALPHIFAGLKVSSTLAIVGAVVGEFVGADQGLGYLLIAANGQLDIELAFCVLVVLTALGILLFTSTELGERLLLPWHISQRRLERPPGDTSVDPKLRTQG